jgi:hypothetical protein
MILSGPKENLIKNSASILDENLHMELTKLQGLSVLQQGLWSYDGIGRGLKWS